MPPRAVTERKQQVDTMDGDDFDFSSQGSDDILIQRAIQAASDKKRKEKERRFVGAATRHLEEANTAARESMIKIHSEVNANVEGFVMNYASIEDAIRATWTEIWEQHEAMAKLEEARCKTNKNASASCEDAHKSALSKMRQACLETEEVVKYVEMQEGEMDKA